MDAGCNQSNRFRASRVLAKFVCCSFFVGDHLYDRSALQGLMRVYGGVLVVLAHLDLGGWVLKCRV